MNFDMDRFAFWTLKVLSYVFLISAAISLILWMCDKESYDHEATSWGVWVTAILTSLFFAATSHVLCRLMERLHIESEREEAAYHEMPENEDYSS